MIKTWSLHTVEYDSVIQKKGVLTHAAMQMNLRSIKGVCHHRQALQPFVYLEVTSTEQTRVLNDAREKHQKTPKF